MTDYGSNIRTKAGRRKAIVWVGVIALMALAGAAFLLWSNHNSQERAIANATAESGGDKVSGAPCDPGTPAGKLGRGDVWKTLVFNQVEYGRRIGNADCSVAKDKSKSGFKAVCQFNAPAELRVVTKTGTSYFDVGLGEPATVTVADSGVTCVKASNAKF